MIDTRTANLVLQNLDERVGQLEELSEVDTILADNQFSERAANLVLQKLGGMGLGINQLCIYVESDQFRERIFEIVEMALQHTKLSIKESK
jgi:hypothetical protein